MNTDTLTIEPTTRIAPSQTSQNSQGIFYIIPSNVQGIQIYRHQMNNQKTNIEHEDFVMQRKLEEIAVESQRKREVNPLYSKGVNLIASNENSKVYSILILNKPETKYSSINLLNRREAMKSATKQAYRLEEDLAKEGFINADYKINSNEGKIFATYSR